MGNANCTNLTINEKELRDVESGKYQSPIDINTAEVRFESYLNDGKLSKPLKVKFPRLMSNLIIQNTGYGWKLDLPEIIAAKTELIGGPLNTHIYRMVQFHCHWGPSINVGSEHTVNKRSYPAELHFVHYNCSLYSELSMAISQPNGLAVVAVFIDIGYQINEELQKVLDQIDSVQYKGDKKLINTPIDISKLMPTKKSYWTYKGSLTTPPLFESVTWILYTTPIYGTIEQISQFRKIFYISQKDSHIVGTSGRLMENYRQTQPLNNRVVYFVRDGLEADQQQQDGSIPQLQSKSYQKQRQYNNNVAVNNNSNNNNNNIINHNAATIKKQKNNATKSRKIKINGWN